MNDIPMPSTCHSHANVEFAASKIDQVRIDAGNRGLCFRCRSGFVTRRERDFDYHVLCTQITQRMPPDIAVCSRFQPSGQLTIFELIQLCDPRDIISRQPAGFKSEAQP